MKKSKLFQSALSLMLVGGLLLLLLFYALADVMQPSSFPIRAPAL